LKLVRQMPISFATAFTGKCRYCDRKRYGDSQVENWVCGL
jgi:hypothetical protein